MTDPNTIEGAISALNEVANAHQSLQSQFQGKQDEIEQNNQAMQNWQTQLGTVDFINPDGSVRTVKTLRQLMADAQMQIDETHPHPYAMRKSTFEAIRAVNKELFAASGFVHFGKHTIDGTVNDGLTCPSSTWLAPKENRFWLGRGLGLAPVMGKSKTAEAVVNIAGVTTQLEAVGEDYNGTSRLFTVKLPPAEDGTRTFDSTTGISTKHSSPEVAFASETETNKVVTDRVDMWGLEAFLREINADDPFVYKYGLIQSKAANIDGVETETDMVRPATYFAWYEGDDSRRGDGVNWLIASESERAKIARNPQNNIYFDDATGKFYQWCVRGRSFAGAGNGDWLWLDYKDPVLKSTTLNSVVPLGALNGKPSFTGNGSDVSTNEIYVGDYRDYQGSHEVIGLGHFTLRNSPDTNQRAVNRECYFLVCGTVSRLNKGAYHPSFNPLGAGCWFNDAVGSGASSYTEGFENSIRTYAATRENAFIRRFYGAINSYSGRPDRRFYDAIYASGPGGVCRDMRYSAWGLTAEDFHNADLKAKSCTLRGREVLYKTRFIPEKVTIGTPAIYAEANVKTTYFQTSFSDNPRNESSAVLQHDHVIAWIIVGNNGNSMIINRVNFQKNMAFWPYHNNSVYLYGSGDVAIEFNEKFPVGTELMIGAQYTAEVSISDEFTHSDVIGHPNEILMCSDLRSGWIGGWIPVIPDGEQDNYPLTRPHSSSEITRANINDSSGKWTVTVGGISSPALNVMTYTNLAANSVSIISYKTKATCTKNSPNSIIYGGRDGLGEVWSAAFYASTWGRTLAYSLIGKVLTGANSGGELSPSNTLLSYSLRSEGVLEPAPLREASHAPLNLHAQLSLGVKALDYHVVNKSQGYINYAYTELVYDRTATDWGDDSKIHIADNQTTMLDENGNKVLVGTAQLIEPLGWIKNDK